MAAVVVGLLCVLGAVAGSPVRTFDQRQQGELNIHAQLDNIVIVLIPTSNLNLLELAGKTKYSSEKPDKGGFLQFFQKPHKDDFDIQFGTDKEGHKTDIDRYETIHDDSDKTSPTYYQNDIKTEVVMPSIASQQVILTQVKNGEKDLEKEEEVVATVQEMKPEIPEKAVDLPKYEASEDGPIKEHSTISETTQESILKVFIPKDLKGVVEKTGEDFKQQVPVESSAKNTDKNEETHSEPSSEPDKKPLLKGESQELEISAPPKEDKPSDKVKLEGGPQESPEHHEPTIQDLIRPVATKEEKTQTSITPKKTPISEDSTFSKKVLTPEEPSSIPKKFISLEESAESSQKESSNSEESSASVKKVPVSQEFSASGSPVRLVEGTRKEKVIRYKPETKWAPGLVDLLGPTKPDERQRFASLCSPGAWDSELKTCIMPGETRSRNELARFLEAMRFGIAVPAH